MENLNEVKQEIISGLKKKSASKKDETAVMKAMLNDREFKVGVYDKTGKVDEYCPAEDVRKMLSDAISTITKMPKKESEQLVDTYEITKNDANVFINIGKEFVNTYLDTGRKLPLGGREKMNSSLQLKNVPEKQYPATSGSDKYITIPSRYAIKASNPCPVWLKNK